MSVEVKRVGWLMRSTALVSRRSTVRLFIFEEAPLQGSKLCLYDGQKTSLSDVLWFLNAYYPRNLRDRLVPFFVFAYGSVVSARVARRHIET